MMNYPTDKRNAVSSDREFAFSDISFDFVRQAQNEFCLDRDWDQYHTPRNLMLALVGEIGELAEIFQWKGEISKGVPELSSDEKTHLGEELSDVLLYLIRLAERCEVDLPMEALRKLKKNAEKYPVSLAKGRSGKHDQSQ
ncbi:dCTP pyrophosphatase 1-like [Varroa jacobsoni]|uniref:dCTP pyrophosphatase 1 n=1 Tax=Varroa destructor TaxID=109461 RepID=A0A7M7JJN7_VARDE|nr:dCTP pyrophosphatase 1-like [Varroa destructor]XP_022652973.1 dCTP pyrophosphatase 1-like [Varroa destructor]XP_022705846.1 dCTP pyrophosphatase 1-like [Varroa jacobsoni]